MPFQLLDYFEKQGLRRVESSLQRIIGKARSFATEPVQFRQAVVQPAWEAVPLPIRVLMGRNFGRWDALFETLRAGVYDLDGDTVAWRPDAQARIAALLRQFFGTGKSKEATTPGTSRYTGNGSPAAQPPLAMPVNPSTSGARIPLAAPVHAPASKPLACSPSEGPAAPRRTSPSAGAAVGIDLGTTYSLVAAVDSQGRPSCIANAAGDLLTPSVVLFDEGGVVVGKEALLASAMEPDKVAECVKRDMGARVYRKKINGEYLPPEVISSLILRSLKADAERRLGPVSRAVITVPAYFEETRRKATMDAGRLAGLEVLDIINEPTAAAIAYGHSLSFLDRSGRLTADRPLRILVYDLGGGTFDVTVMEIKGRHFRALATDGDVCLGGKDWDEKLVELAADRFRHQFREDPRDNPISLQNLTLAAEAAKRTLSERKKATLFVNHLGSQHKVEVTREEFEEATAALLERTRVTAELVARQASLTWEEIDRVLLVGGSTRMPMVTRMLEELTGKPPDRSVSADEAVACGAALYAGLLAPRQDKEQDSTGFTITDVCSHSLGILGAKPGTGRKINKILIRKNSTLPHTATRQFQTLKPNQRSVVVSVLEGESEHPESCTRLGVCTIRDLPPDLPASWPIQVSYTYQANGRLHVTAKVKGHAAAVAADFERENSLPDEDLELWRRFVREEIAEVPD